MDWIIYSTIFFGSAWLMHLSGGWIIDGLTRLSKVLGVREFIVGFLVMASAASLPNLFLGITSATRGIPELSLGDVFGNNFVAMTLAVAVAIFFAKKKEVETGGKTVQTTAVFTMGSALLPIILLFDGVLSRTDGIILIGLFFAYILWLFSQQNLFSQIYSSIENDSSPIIKIKESLKDASLVAVSLGILIMASIGIVLSASFFAVGFGVPLLIIGLLMTGLGNAMPEIYFAVASSKRGETQLIIGNLMGSVIFPATLVLGIVSLIHPITASFALAMDSRVFLLIASILFLIFAKSKNKISLPEGIILMLLYLTFVLFVIFI